MNKINPELNKKDYKPTKMMKAPSNHEKLAEELNETIDALLYNADETNCTESIKNKNKENKIYEK